MSVAIEAYEGQETYIAFTDTPGKTLGDFTLQVSDTGGSSTDYTATLMEPYPGRYVLEMTFAFSFSTYHVFEATLGLLAHVKVKPTDYGNGELPKTTGRIPEGEPVKVYWYAPAGQTIGSFMFFSSYNGGGLALATPTSMQEIVTPGPSLYLFTFDTPGLGSFSILNTDMDTLAQVEVVEVAAGGGGGEVTLDQATLDLLKNLEDVAMGSWQWDKATGNLKFYRQTGDEFAEFSVVEDTTTASRERI